MLSPTEQNEISGEFSRYERKSAVCIEALRIVQRHRGFIDDGAIIDIAGFLDLSPADVDGVATFYNLIFRKPVGRKVIFICDSVSCWVMGCNQLIDYFKFKHNISLGETTPDRSFTLLPIACLGHCEAAPVLRVNEEIVRNVNEKCIDRIFLEPESLGQERNTA